MDSRGQCLGAWSPPNDTGNVMFQHNGAINVLFADGHAAINGNRWQLPPDFGSSPLSNFWRGGYYP